MANPALVLLHGWGFDTDIWLPLIPYLEKNYTIYNIALPGFGKQPLIDWPRFKDEILIKLPARFALIGWSLGGLYAIRLASEAPTRVTHLLTIGTSPKFIQDAAWPGVKAAVFTTFLENLAIDPRKTWEDFKALQARGHFDALPPTPMPTIAALNKGLVDLQTWDLREQLASLNLPICCLFGRLDPIVPLGVAKYIGEFYKQIKTIIFPKSGHLLFLSDKDLFLQILQDFII